MTKTSRGARATKWRSTCGGAAPAALYSTTCSMKARRGGNRPLPTLRVVPCCHARLSQRRWSA
eukprot:3882870-Pleurochrysis_carterae.AAC.10